MRAVARFRPLHYNTRQFASFPFIMEDAGSVAVVKHFEGEDRFTFSFVMRNTELNIQKQFNMERPLNEPSQQFLKRLNANVEKVVAKKTRKKRKQEEPSEFAEAAKHVVFKKHCGSVVEGSDDTEMKEILLGADCSLTMDVMGQVFSLVVNPPLVDKMKIQGRIMAGFLVYPFKLKLFFASLDHSSFEWFVSEIVSEGERKKVNKEHLVWTKKSEGFFYSPTTNDIDCYLKVTCMPRNTDSKDGIMFEAVSTDPISPGPGTCPFENRHAFTKTSTGVDEVRFMTYNLLADLYADSEYSRTVLHPQCPPYALAIDYRKQLIIKELLGYNADVICLQEVDRKVFNGDLDPVLSRHGLEGAFDLKGVKVDEGVACFWRKDKFRLTRRNRYFLSDHIQIDPAFTEFLQNMEPSVAAKESLFARTTTLQIAVLRNLDNPERSIIVGTTHLYFQPDADHIRMLQAGICMRLLQTVLEEERCQNPDVDHAVFFCGDMNSTPPCGVPEFLIKGVIGPDHKEWKSADGEHVTGMSLVHPFSMDSACGMPKYTNFTTGFSDCLDYIFYQKDKFDVKEVIPFPSEEELQMHVAIPNVLFPSDHIACVADLRWKA